MQAQLSAPPTSSTITWPVSYSGKVNVAGAEREGGWQEIRSGIQAEYRLYEALYVMRRTWALS